MTMIICVYCGAEYHVSEDMFKLLSEDFIDRLPKELREYAPTHLGVCVHCYEDRKKDTRELLHAMREEAEKIKEEYE